jgi:hypothetical protein
MFAPHGTGTAPGGGGVVVVGVVVVVGGGVVVVVVVVLVVVVLLVVWHAGWSGCFWQKPGGRAPAVARA